MRLTSGSLSTRAKLLRSTATGITLGCVVAAGSTVAQITPTAAHADTAYYYCGQLVPARSQCPSKIYSLPLQGNRATYPGSGVVSVCERVERTSNGDIVSRRCANGTVASDGDLPNGPSNTGIVGNNDDGQHTVNGKGVTL